MTAFFIYFETKNISSTNYDGFSEVGNFIVPKMINSGKIPIIFNKKKMMASMISDGSNHGIVDYFISSNKHLIRDVLFNFINKRIENDAIVANIIRFIYDNQESLIFDCENVVNINFSDFKTNFNDSLFELDQCVQVMI